ncbi:DUF5301 domain-containing protein [Clostridium intestinale]|uniref:DUF5301 domain-containing protein n=1 Tax=Clostridium intestinale URNW TaxID=1294142 RepID=U2PXE0_9CLOT|nr:DUF5301 domain-containing protein [Clostridium intestinale]ERK31115.1 hypothetical protein CINTURNW_2549 [Clostridium intestinale URNW]
MKKKKHISVILLIMVILAIYTSFSIYGRQGLLGDKVINKYVTETISKIRIVRVSDNLEVNIKDKEQISTLIDSLSNLQVKGYKENIPPNNDETYYMWIYENSNIRLGITIYTVGYISVFEFNDKTSNSECYKVIKDIDKLDINKYL